MDLYFSPLACSLATRIALYEAGAEANYLEVDPKTKIVQNDGSDFKAVNPLGLVPTLRTDDGLVLTENAAILQYVADRFPQAGIATGPGIDRSRLHQWLCFIGTELHKGLFVPMLDKKAPPEVKTYDLGKGLSRLDYLDRLPRGPRIPARSFQRRRRLPRHHHQLDHGDAADRAGEMAPCEGVSRKAARAAQHRQGGRRGVQAVPGRTRPAQGGGVRRRWRGCREAVSPHLNGAMNFRRDLLDLQVFDNLYRGLPPIVTVSRAASMHHTEQEQQMVQPRLYRRIAP